MSLGDMTPKERVMAAIYDHDLDFFPAICPTSVANFECMRLTNSFFPKAHFDAQSMADLAASAHHVLGFDTVMPYFSVHLEAEVLGCTISWGDGTVMPVITKRPFDRVEQFEPPANFLNRPLCKQLLKAIRLLKKQSGGEVGIIGKVVGPWSLAYNLYGAENLLLDTILEPKRTFNFINELSSIPIEFAKAQFEAGADMITWADHVTSDLISAKLYEEFVLPIHKLAAAKLENRGPIILHICGNVMDRLDLIKKTGFKIFHIDSRNDIQKAVEICSDNILLTGSINNPYTLTNGSTSDVKKEVRRNIEQGIKLISPECAIPFKVPNANLLELVNSIHRAPLSSLGKTKS